MGVTHPVVAARFGLTTSHTPEVQNYSGCPAECMELDEW